MTPSTGRMSEESSGADGLDLSVAFTVDGEGCIWLGQPPEAALGLVVLRPGVRLQPDGLRVHDDLRVRGRTWPWDGLRLDSVSLVLTGARQNAVDGLLDAVLLHPLSALGGLAGRTSTIVVFGCDARGRLLEVAPGSAVEPDAAQAERLGEALTVLLQGFAASPRLREWLAAPTRFAALLARLREWDGRAGTLRDVA